MSHIQSSCRLASLVLGLLLVEWATAVEAAPVVQSITPNAARAGEVLKVDGSGFKGTRDVYFASGSTVKSAKFRVIDDDHLELTFPEYYRGAGSASIIVVGANSVTVAMSDQMKTVDSDSKTNVTAPFLNVIKDAIVDHASGVAVVGDGAIVTRLAQSPVCFVKKSGTVQQFDGALIFHEPGAVFNTYHKIVRTPPKEISVQQITISPNVDPVLIRAPEKPQPFAKHPPVLTSLTPSLATWGDIVTFKGKNFSQVSNVYFATTNRTIEAGFKAVDDSTLRVEVPQNATGRQLLLIVNPAGCAVSISDNPATPFHNLDPREAKREEWFSREFHLESVYAGRLADPGVGRIVVVEKGGIVTKTGPSCLLLVQNGGRVGANLGPGCVVFYESDATIPTSAAGQKFGTDVGKFVFTPHPLKLDIDPR